MQDGSLAKAVQRVQPFDAGQVLLKQQGVGVRVQFLARLADVLHHRFQFAVEKTRQMVVLDMRLVVAAVPRPDLVVNLGDLFEFLRTDVPSDHDWRLLAHFFSHFDLFWPL